MNAVSAIEDRVFAVIPCQPRPPRLLVVDDQPLNIETLFRVFTPDHQVLMATSGAQAVALCASQQPDLVLLDLVMPGMDGYEVCRRLKADPATRDIPVIFVTGYADETAETQGLEAGAVDFIAKPVNPRIVRARVRTHLTLKAQSDLLRQWVYIDGLTGVHNRRYFDERLDCQWRESVRGETAMGLVLIDIDHFKSYNDLYGHQAGDDCLRRIARELRDGLRRPADLLTRYGGEEFACLLPQTGIHGAMRVARELEQRIRAIGIRHHGSVLNRVTISLGVAARIARPGATAAALLADADIQLYRAKSRGRGRACGEES